MTISDPSFHHHGGGESKADYRTPHQPLRGRFNMEVIWKPRDETTGNLIDQYITKRITWDQLNQEFYNRGWSTRYLFEAVRAAEKAHT